MEYQWQHSCSHVLWIQIKRFSHLFDAIAKIASFLLSGLRKSRETRDMGDLGESMATNLRKLIATKLQEILDCHGA